MHLTEINFQFAGIIKYIYPAIVNCVLLAAGGNHSTDIISGSTVRKIRAFYHDTGYGQVISLNLIFRSLPTVGCNEKTDKREEDNEKEMEPKSFSCSASYLMPTGLRDSV